MRTPIIYRSTRRVRFSDLDPYDHLSTGRYATYYVDHRMEGLREYAGWDLQTLATLPFMVWVHRIEIDFIRPVRGDQDITIISFVREVRGPDAIITGSMADAVGKAVSRCLMTVAHVDKKTSRATDWPPELMPSETAAKCPPKLGLVRARRQPPVLRWMDAAQTPTVSSRRSASPDQRGPNNHNGTPGPPSDVPAAGPAISNAARSSDRARSNHGE